jgi:hypothetical protein
MDRKPVAVTCFLDESATDGSTPCAIVGGLLINEIGHKLFLEDWERFLDRFSLWPGLHMKEFSKEGRFGNRTVSERKGVFSRAVDIINEYKIYSLSCCLPNDIYNDVMSDEAKKYHSQYQLCFLMAALANGKMAAHNNYAEPVAFVMDKGNPNAEDVRRGHKEMQDISLEEGLPRNLGSLCFKDDESELALQAADLISWSARRKASGKRFGVEHDAIVAMLSDEETHSPIDLPEEGVRKMAAHFGGGPLGRR